MSKVINICVWCGSSKAYVEEREYIVCCPTCGKRVDILHNGGTPLMHRGTLEAMIEARYGNAATAALRRKPTTKMEKKVCETWENPEYAGVLPVLLANRFNFPNGEMTARDAAVVRQVMIWLGSPVGQHFLYECGFTAAGEQA